MKAYDQALLNEGYSIEELVDKASNAILPHCLGYNNIVIVCGPGNNGADGLSLGIKLHIRARNVKLYCFGNPNKFSQANNFYIEQAQEMEVPITFMDEETISDIIKNKISYEDIDEFDMSLICSVLHCDARYFTDREVRNKDLLISTMNRGKDSVKSKNVKAKIQDYMNDLAFVNEVLLEEA